MTQTLSNLDRSRGNAHPPKVRLGGFGKHPGWADHITGVGESTTALAELRRVLYLEGISTTLGNWEDLPPEARITFDHWVFSVRADRLLLARVMSSVDRIGRTDFPFIVAADIDGASLAAVISELQPPFAEFARRCRELPTADAVRAAFATDQRVLENRLSQVVERAGGNPVTIANRQAFADQQAFDPEGLALARVLYRVESSWQAYASGRGGRAPKLKGPGVVHRLPSLQGEPGISVRMWDEFLDLFVHPDVPRLYVFPATLPWVDVIVGNPDGSHFLGLLCDRTRVIPESDVPYERNEERVLTEFKLRAAGLLRKWRAGPGDLESTPPSSPADAAKAWSEALPQAEPDVAFSARSSTEPPAALPAGPKQTDTGVPRDSESVEPKDSEPTPVMAAPSEAPPSPLAPVSASANSSVSPATAGATEPAVSGPVAPSSGREVPTPSDELPSELAGQAPLPEAAPATPATEARPSLPAARPGPGAEVPRAPKPETPEAESSVERPNPRIGAGKPPAWVLAAAVLLVVSGLGIWMALRPHSQRDNPVKRLAQQAEAAWKKPDFAVALAAYRQWVQMEPTNSLAAQRLSQLEGGVELSMADASELTAGTRKLLPVKVRDVLGRPVTWEASAEVLPKGDRLEKTGDGWVYTAGIGAARQARIRLTATNGMGGTSTTIVLSITADLATTLLSRADQAYDNGKYAKALEDYRAYVALRPDAQASKRIKDIDSPPRAVPPGPFEVEEGQTVKFELAATDSLSRPVSFRVDDLAAIAARGVLTEISGSDGRVWSFVPTRGKVGELSLAFVADNGTRTSPVVVRVKVNSDRVAGIRATAAQALASGAFWPALTNYLALLQLRPSDDEALKAVSALRQPPAVSFEGPVDAVAGQTRSGSFALKWDARPHPALPWDVEVDGSQLGAGELRVEKGSADRKPWTWRTAPGIETNGLVRFRALSPTATSEWKQVSLSVKLPAPVTIEGLPTTVTLKAGTTNSVLLGFGSGKIAGAGLSSKAWMQPTNAAPDVAVREAAPGQWVATLGPPRGAGRFSLFVVVARADQSVTSLVEVVVSPARAAVVGIGDESFLWVPDDQGGSWPDKPAKGYWVSRSETSWAEYLSVMEGLPKAAKAEDASRDDLPVVSVTAEEAVQYCSRRTSQSESVLHGWHFELPTLQQWKKYSKNGEVPPDAVLDDRPLHGVREGIPNSLRVWHAVGNVAELCRPDSSGKAWVVGLSFSDKLDEPSVNPDVTSFQYDSDRGGRTIGFRVVLVPPR